MQASTIQPTFKLELNHKVIPNIVTIAKYDGTHPCLTASAGYDKLIIHHPHGGGGIGTRAQRSQGHKEVSELNLSQEVVAVAAGALKPCTPRDMLVIGSPTQILGMLKRLKGTQVFSFLAYDVHDNSDLFYKDAPDGVTVITCGSLGKSDEVLAIVGGTSSVQGLTWQGEEVFWNVVGGKVCSLLVMDFDKDGEAELLVGCEDLTIRVLKNNQFVTELTETGSVHYLSNIGDGRFAYALGNGTIGVYEDGVRVWRVKSKQNAISLQRSGNTLACCWHNGRVDWRDAATGRVLRRVQMRSQAAAMLWADYRSVGACDLICVSDKGEVLGYPPYKENSSSFSTATSQPTEKDRNAITELFNRKQALLLEMQHYEANATSGGRMDGGDYPATAMPSNTKLQVAVTAAPDERCLDLIISTNNETIVRAALVLAEGVFETGETLAKHPALSQLRPRLHVPLRPPRDISVDVHIKALVGYQESEQFHIFELTKILPKFSMYTMQPTLGRSQQKSYVTFNITERLQRICLWINQIFLLEEEFMLDSEEAKEMNITFECIRNQERLDMDFNINGSVKMSTPDMKLASDLVQSLTAYLNISDLQSTVHFPEVEQKLRDEMSYISQIGDTKAHLAAETAEQAQLITALLPAAQDAGTYNLKEMLSRYKEVVLLNEELLSGCHIRRDNHDLAVAALKRVHTTLQHAARLRVGKHAKAVVSASRVAVKEDNVEALIKVLQVGGA